MSPGIVPGSIPGLILAGGLARRMGGGDKALLTVGGRTVLDRLIARLRPQVSALAINANGDPARFSATGLPVLPDTLPDFPGPLAGVLAGMAWAAAQGAAWLVTAPGDTPFLPDDLVARLQAGRGGMNFACAASGGRTHPVAALWPVSARAELLAALMAGQRKIDAFTRPDRTAVVPWDATGSDPFFNVNTPDDLVQADRLAV